MGTGIDTRSKGNGQGGFRMAINNEHIMGLVGVAMDSGESGNPFQNLGLEEDMIFDIAEPSTFAAVRDRVEEIFEIFERDDLAALQKRSDNLKTIRVENDRGGEYGIMIYVINLETDTPFAMTVTGGTNGVTVTGG